MIVPPVVLHVTDVSSTPETVAVNSCVRLGARVTSAGVTTTMGAISVVTVAEALLLVSATLVAVTVQLPSLAGAVYVTVLPVPVMTPQVTLHVTPVSLLPVTIASKAVLVSGAIVTAVGSSVRMTSSGAFPVWHETREKARSAIMDARRMRIRMAGLRTARLGDRVGAVGRRGTRRAGGDGGTARHAGDGRERLGRWAGHPCGCGAMTSAALRRRPGAAASTE